MPGVVRRASARPRDSLHVNCLMAQQGSHAAGDAQGGHDGREDADDELQDEFPGFLSHSGYRL